MTDSPMDSGTGPHAMLNRVLPLLRDKKLAELADLYAEDGVHELPYAPAGAPGRIEGRERVREYFTTALSRVPLEFHEFQPLAIHDTADPELIVAEYDATGTVSNTGRAFTTRFVWVLRVVDERIACWRDYMNPQQIMNLQAEAD